MGRARPNNWVDRGLRSEDEIARLLAAFLDTTPEDPTLEPVVAACVGLVASFGVMSHLAGYLRHVEVERGREPASGRERRVVASAVWHAAKVAFVRDAAELEIERLRAQLPDPPPLGAWLRAAILRAP